MEHEWFNQMLKVNSDTTKYSISPQVIKKEASPKVNNSKSNLSAESFGEKLIHSNSKNQEKKRAKAKLRLDNNV